ncbi:hypothetical protein Tco_1209501 [Tanacetum coccineum]
MTGLSIGPPGFVGLSHLSVFNSPAKPTSLYHPQSAQATSFYQQQQAQSHLAHLQQVHATVLPPPQPAQHVTDSATVAQVTSTATKWNVSPTTLLGQATNLPHAFSTMTLQDLASGVWNMDTDASSHLNNFVNSLSEIFSTCMYLFISVGEGHSILVTNTGPSILSTPLKSLHLNNVLITPHIVKNLIFVRQFVRDNNCTIEFDAFDFSVKDFLTCRVLLRCDSTGDLYPVTSPSLIPHAFLVSQHTWHQTSTDAALRNQGASIKTLEIQIGQMSKALQERGFESLPSSTETNTRDQVKSISTAIEVDSHPIRRIRSTQYAIPTGLETRQTTIPFPSHLNEASVSVMSLLTYLNLGLGELAHTKLIVELADRTMKYPKGIAENVLTILSTARAKIDVYKRKITLRVGEENIIFKSVKPASSLIKRVYMLSLRERIELDLEARLIGETLVLNRSLDPFLEDYIALNEPIELRRNQGDDLMPTIEEGEVIEEFRTRDDELNNEIDDYPSYCDYDKKIHIDYAHNLKFSCMIGFEFTHVNFYLLSYVNVMSKKFHNSIMKDKMVYKGDNVVGALMNVPIFVGTFSVVTDFAVLEDMDAYRDEGMGDVIGLKISGLLVFEKARP